MELNETLDKYKKNALNIAIIIFALIISKNIYQKQLKQQGSLKQQIEEETKKSGILKSIGDKEHKIGSYKQLIRKKDASTPMNIISGIANESGLSIISIKPSIRQQSADVVKESFNLTIEAPDYNSLGKFISRLESLEDIYVVDAIDIRYKTKALSVNLAFSSIEPEG